MKLKNLISATIMGVALSTASLAAAAAETILFNCFFPPQHPVCKVGVKELAKRVETATQGRVKVRIPPKSLASPPKQYEAVRNGVMDGGLQFNAFFAKKIPGIQFSLLPFEGKENAEATSRALWNTYQKHFANKGEFDDIHLLAVHASNGADIFSTTDEQITSIDDISRRKMWALPGATAITIKGTGSAVVSGPAVQMLEIISRGVVDGYTGVPFASVLSFKLMDYTESAVVYDRKIFQPTFSYFVSKEKWNKISAADQAAIDAALGADFSAFLGALNDKINVKALKMFSDAGKPIVEGSPEMLSGLIALGQPITDAWLAKVASMGVDGNAVLSDYTSAYDAAVK